jgi:hypothetical protein
MYASVELGVRPLDFKRLGHVALGHASDAEAAYVAKVTDASVVHDFSPTTLCEGVRL